MMGKKRLVFLAAAALFCLGQIAQAAPLSTSEMIMVLRDAKVVSPGTRLDVIQSDQEATVITKRSGKMNDDDCKIKAVLMAKALMDAQPKHLASVKVIYTLDGENVMTKVVVSVGDVQAFAKGAITEKQLLASLDLSRESEAGNDGDAGLAPGPQREKRAVLQSRIQGLKQGGTGVAPFQKIFNDIEELTRAGKTKEAAQLIAELSTKLTEQESLRDQARRVGEGKGVKRQGSAFADAGNRQTWKPGGDAAGGSSSLDALKKMEYQGKIAQLRNRVKLMSARGMQTSDLESRLDYAEQQFAKLSPEAAVASLETIRNDIDRAAQSQFPNAGAFRKKFNGQ